MPARRVAGATLVVRVSWVVGSRTAITASFCEKYHYRGIRRLRFDNSQALAAIARMAVAGSGTGDNL